MATLRPLTGTARRLSAAAAPPQRPPDADSHQRPDHADAHQQGHAPSARIPSAPAPARPPLRSHGRLVAASFSQSRYAGSTADGVASAAPAGRNGVSASAAAPATGTAGPGLWPSASPPPPVAPVGRRSVRPGCRRHVAAVGQQAQVGERWPAGDQVEQHAPEAVLVAGRADRAGVPGLLRGRCSWTLPSTAPAAVSRCSPSGRPGLGVQFLPADAHVQAGCRVAIQGGRPGRRA